MLILRIRQAEVATAAGRLDEAFDLVQRDGRFRSHRRGQEAVTGLVALLGTGGPMRKVYVQPIDSAGNTSAPIEVGIIEFNARDPRLVSLGTSVAVTWNYAMRRQVALVSP